MIKPFRFLIYALLLMLSSCVLTQSMVVHEYDTMPTTKNHNVCKQLTDTIMVYAVFVDVNIYHPWTEFDIDATIDSLKRATTWLEGKATIYNKKLKIESVIHTQGAKRTIAEKSAKTSLRLNGIRAASKRAYKKMIPWADAISKYAGRGTKYKPSTKIHQRWKILGTESLNLALRDKYKRENVAIMFFVNGYYENHPSYSFYTATTNQHVEYSIVTNKNPSVIAHELMHLFGAVDLYANFNFPNFNYKELSENYPNEIMNVQHKDIDKLSVSPISSYFIGWQDTLDKANTRLLLHKQTFTDY